MMFGDFENAQQILDNIMTVSDSPATTAEFLGCLSAPKRSTLKGHDTKFGHLNENLFVNTFS
jgi:hypothetical protein